MNSPSPVSPLSEEQLADWCSDWAAAGGMGLLAKVHLQTLITHLMSRKLSLAEVQRQLGLASTGMDKMLKPPAPVVTPPAAVEPAPAEKVEEVAKEPQPEPSETSPEEAPASQDPATEGTEGTLPGFE